MNNQAPLQAILITQNTPRANQNSVRLAVFNEDGSPKSFPDVPIEAQADSTAETVADLVSDFNDLLAKLRGAGIMEES